MKKIIAVYDNGGESSDRYTIVLNLHEIHPLPEYDCLVLFNNPEHPQGISLYTSCLLGTNLGKKIKFKDLPKHIQNHVKWRLEGDD